MIQNRPNQADQSQVEAKYRVQVLANLGKEVSGTVEISDYAYFKVGD